MFYLPFLKVLYIIFIVTVSSFLIRLKVKEKWIKSLDINNSFLSRKPSIYQYQIGIEHSVYEKKLTKENIKSLCVLINLTDFNTMNLRTFQSSVCPFFHMFKFSRTIGSIYKGLRDSFSFKRRVMSFSNRR